MKAILVFTMALVTFAGTAHAHSLAEAAEKAAAIKAARVAKGDWVPVTSTAAPEAGVVPLPAVDVPVDTAAAVVPADGKAVTKALDPGTEAKNRIAAVALLGDPLTALHDVPADQA